MIILNKNNNSIFYEPGDHLAIIPVNRLELVEKIMRATRDIVNQNDYLTLEELVEINKNGSKKNSEIREYKKERFLNIPFLHSRMSEVVYY